MYSRLEQWGFKHKTVNHSAGEYARDEDGDGFCEVHSNTMEGFWSLLRPWLRPHRGISQDKLPLYLSFFEFIHNVRKRGKALLSSLLSTLVKKTLTPIVHIEPIPNEKFITQKLISSITHYFSEYSIVNDGLRNVKRNIFPRNVDIMGVAFNYDYCDSSICYRSSTLYETFSQQISQRG